MELRLDDIRKVKESVNLLLKEIRISDFRYREGCDEKGNDLAKVLK